LGEGWAHGMMSLAIPRDLAQAVRSGNLFSNRGTTVLDAPEPDRVSSMGAKSTAFKRRAAVTEMPLRRDTAYGNDFADDYGDGLNAEAGFSGRARRPGIRLSFRGGLVPKTLWGRIAAGCGLLLVTGAGIAAGLFVRSFLLHDEHFVVPSSDSIQIAGNSHLTRPQLLSVFGEDVDRNIFNVPLADRRAELESLPWVAHATVMRLLPNHIRVAIVERTPVAFVRQGTQIGLVDANGALFDLPGPDMENAASQKGKPGVPQYSFPVLTGISASDPLSTRAARMRIYMGFLAALDAGGEDVSHRLSEVDVSNPEDVRAIIPDAGANSAAPDILVHFGEEKFLERYHQYQEHLPEWRTQYPKLASVDMRYEQQVVLEMQPGTVIPSGDSAPAAAATSPAATPAAPAKAAALKRVATAKSRVAKKKQTAVKTKLKKGKPAGAASQGTPR
jgi:cell division protein FtsQ